MDRDRAGFAASAAARPLLIPFPMVQAPTPKIRMLDYPLTPGCPLFVSLDPSIEPRAKPVK